MDAPYAEAVVSHASNEVVAEPDLIAIGLLKLQQRFDALDRLYNEEIGALHQELARLKADYVRLYQSRSPHQNRPVLPQKGKSTRGQVSRSPHKS